ncbi:MAG: TetR/AcrR family transcriptional regulator [Planctomycetota bacterium]|nr:MAG: TetR/AcrR family transcriptional regulator [Planctomycetota bacterium]
MSEAWRANQRHRTRKDLLSAAARLMKAGRCPTVAEVAEEARISRATAYRYFPSREVLMAEAPLDGAVPTPEELFAQDPSTDPEERIERAEKALHAMVQANEPQLRMMLARSLELPARQRDGIPVRQNRRGALIEAALQPARHRFDDSTYELLRAALAHFFGTESMVVATDVLQLSPRDARAVKSWAIRALVRAGLERSRGKTGGRPRRR